MKIATRTKTVFAAEHKQAAALVVDEKFRGFQKIGGDGARGNIVEDDGARAAEAAFIQGGGVGLQIHLKPLGGERGGDGDVGIGGDDEHARRGHGLDPGFGGVVAGDRIMVGQDARGVVNRAGVIHPVGEPHTRQAILKICLALGDDFAVALQFKGRGQIRRAIDPQAQIENIRLASGHAGGRIDGGHFKISTAAERDEPQIERDVRADEQLADIAERLGRVTVTEQK